MYKYLTIFFLLGLVSSFAKDNDYINIQYSKPYVERYIYNDGTYPGDDEDFDNIIENVVEKEIEQCPNTPKGICVDKNGCPQKIKKTINFRTGSYIINVSTIGKINDIVDIAQECFGYKIKITGHTDSTSSEKFNTLLSKQRAMAVRDYMLRNDIDIKRLTILWEGELTPIASNMMAPGRAKNRRVEIVFQ